MYFKVIFWNATKLKAWLWYYQGDVGLLVELYRPMCGYISMFCCQSSHALTSSLWVCLTFNCVYTTFIPDSIEVLYRCLNPANRIAQKRTVELEMIQKLKLAHCVIHYLFVWSFETFGERRIDILDNLWEKWNVVEYLRPPDKFSKLSTVEEVNFWKSALFDEKIIFGYLMAPGYLW